MLSVSSHQGSASQNHNEISLTPVRMAIVKKTGHALAGVAHWIECWTEKQRVCRFDSQLGHMPGLRARSPVGGAFKATTLMFLSLSFSLPSPISKINK